MFFIAVFFFHNAKIRQEKVVFEKVNDLLIAVCFSRRNII